MLQSRRAKMIVALVASICLWAYVTGTIDPSITKKYTAIPIEIINEDSLIQEDLAVDSVTSTTVDLNLTGSRADLNNLNKDDIKVTADMFGRHKGNNYVNLDVQVPKGISIDSKSLQRLEVHIDDLVTSEKDVKVKVKGTLPESTTLGETQIYPEHVMVYGTKNNVNKVSYLEATVNADRLSMEKSTHQSRVTPMDKSGKQVPYIMTSRSNVEIEATLAKFKKVKFDVKTIGQINDQYEVESITMPDTIEIEGKMDILKGIEVIEAQPVDISNVTNSTKIEIKPILPKGVKLKDSQEKLYVDIIIKGAATKEISFNGSQISVLNLDEGLDATISENVTIKIQGKQNILNSLTKKDFKLSVDAKNLGVGNHKVKLEVEADTADVTVLPIKEKINIEIREE